MCKVCIWQDCARYGQRGEEGKELEENTITIVECRKLREYVRDITSGCILTRDEYNQIRDIIMGAMKRCLEESDKNENTTDSV